jgi:hypothetical protein
MPLACDLPPPTLNLCASMLYCGLLGSDIWWITMLQRNVLPPSSFSLRLQDYMVTTQKTAIYVFRQQTRRQKFLIEC